VTKTLAGLMPEGGLGLKFLSIAATSFASWTSWALAGRLSQA
jgi:hypothetical protein